MTYPTNISPNDAGWREITLTSKSGNGANVRYSPLILSNNIAGRIHPSPESKGIANPNYAYDDGTYKWYPAIIDMTEFENAPFIWIASEVFNYTLGDFVNVGTDPLFYDLALPGQPTIRIPVEQKTLLVEVLRAVADYLDALSGVR
jgi:hypothetical protein